MGVNKEYTRNDCKKVLKNLETDKENSRVGR